MELEQTLQDYKIKENILGEIYTSGLEMYAMSGMGLPGPMKHFGIGSPKPLRCASGPYGGTLGRLLEGEIRPIKPTETKAINLDEVYKKLRVTEKYHPDGTYKTVFGLKDNQINTSELNNTLDYKKLLEDIMKRKRGF